ncbi:unnamed protein product [Effrenium voratum]|nr:unnamed protein product [Effrenium voratum]
MRTSIQLLTWASHAQIRGDIAEAGVWRGGHSLLLKFATEHLQIRTRQIRRVWLLDSFQGFGQNNSGVDAVFNGVNNSAEGWRSVANLFRDFTVLDSRVVLLRGFYQDTLWRIPPFSRFVLLRVDCDMYNSVVQVLCYLYDLVTVGGFVIIDDWGSWPQAQLAVREFLELNGLDQQVRVNIRQSGEDALREARGREPARPMHKVPMQEDVGDVWWQKTSESQVATGDFCLQRASVQARASNVFCTSDCLPACCL